MPNTNQKGGYIPCFSIGYRSTLPIFLNITQWIILYAPILEETIPTSKRIASVITKYFAKNKKRTANVLAGPKREGWFSAEAYAALCKAGNPFSFSCWGETEFLGVYAMVKAKTRKRQGVRKRPDLVCYLPEDGKEAIDAILEVKLLLNDEGPRSILKDLKKQLRNARRLAPKSKVMGIVLIAGAPLGSPSMFEKNIKTAKSEVERLLPAREGFFWIPGYDFAQVFESVDTAFPFPHMPVSLAVGVRELRCR